jgi:phage terminase Nu1 subunit (DNA packaging protein)
MAKRSPKKKPKQKPHAAALSVRAIAKQLNVVPGTVYDWIARGCPRTTLAAVEAWRAANIRQEHARHDKRTADPKTGDAQPDVALTLTQKRMVADTRKINADVVYKRLRNAEKRKDMVSLAAVEREAAELVVRIKERLLAAPSEFENSFPAEVRAQCKADFEEHIRLLLLEMANWKIAGQTCDDMIAAAAERIVRERRNGGAAGATSAR